MASRDSVRGHRGARFGKWLGLGFLWSISAWGVDSPPPSQTGESLQIVVRVYDYAHLPRGILTATEAEATRIFRKAGIETVWVECSGVDGQNQIDPACQQEFGPTDLHLIILSRDMAQRLDFRDAELGRAPAPTEITPGSFARVFYVYYDRVKALVEGRHLGEGNLLGHAVAHEIGHVLLPALGHTSAGIMRAPWSGKDLQSVAKGNLLFAPSEAQQLRAAVRARLESVTAVRIPFSAPQ